MDPKVQQSWEQFLDPEITRPRLIRASIYIAGFEVLKDCIVHRIRDFFWNGFDEAGETIDPKYQSDVLTRNRSPVYASLDWLMERKAIDDRDVCTFERVKRCRNTLAHNLFSAVASDGLPTEFEQCFKDMIDLLSKIEIWWIANVEIPINPDYDGVEIDESGIVPGTILGMQLLLDITLGDPEQSRMYFDKFRSQRQAPKPASAE